MKGKSKYELKSICIFFICTHFFFPILLLNAQQAQWRLASGTNGFAAADIDIYYNDPDTMYAIGGYTNSDTAKIIGSGILISTDRGETQRPIKGGPSTDYGALKVDPFDSKRIYVSSYGIDLEANDIYITTDGGTTWKRLFLGREYTAPVVEIDPVDLKTVYVGVGPGFIYRSSDRGETWERITTPPAKFLNSLAIALSNNSILYAGYVSGLFKSTDKGNSWIQLPLEVGAWGISCVAIDPHDANIVYASVFSRGLPPGGVYKSTDGGTTWNVKNDGLDSTNWNIYAMVFNPANTKQLFLGNGFPVYFFKTTDAGDHWINYSDGLYGGGVSSIVIDTTSNRITVGGSGIYINDSLVGIHNPSSKQPNTFLLYQNYPNPFNGTTIITYELSERAFVSLSLYDVLGRKVKMLLEDIKSPGIYKATMEGGDLPSGIYFYQLRAGSFSQTLKTILVR